LSPLFFESEDEILKDKANRSFCSEVHLKNKKNFIPRNPVPKRVNSSKFVNSNNNENNPWLNLNDDLPNQGTTLNYYGSNLSKPRRSQNSFFFNQQHNLLFTLIPLLPRCNPPIRISP